jgi:4-hydroxybenzoate polyprenyltransferase
MFLRDCLRLARWREWAQSKLLYGAGGALLLFPDAPTPLLMVMIATVAPWAAFGYAINEVADRDADRRAGKLNRAAPLPNLRWALFLIVSAAMALGLSLCWAADAAPPLFVLAGMTLAAAYSLPPLRLKERGAIGLVAAATAQWALPVLALSAALPRGWLRPAAWSLVLLGLAIGMRWIAVHQLADATRDRMAGVRTFATGGGPTWAVIRYALAAEVMLLVTALALTWPQSMPAVLALGGWIGAAELPRLRRESLRSRLEGYRAAPLRDYYFILLPGSLVLGRMLSSPMPLAPAALLLPIGWLGVARVIDRRTSDSGGH